MVDDKMQLWWSCNDQLQWKMCDYVTNDTLNISVKVKLHGRQQDVVMLAFKWPNDNEKRVW